MYIMSIERIKKVSVIEVFNPEIFFYLTMPQKEKIPCAPLERKVKAVNCEEKHNPICGHLSTFTSKSIRKQ